MFKLDKAKDKVAVLNEQLQKKCKKLSLEIGFHSEFKNRPNVSIYENMKNPQIILCLNLGTHCISSIACKITKSTKSMEISSKTHEAHEGKKYNTLMRAVILLVASSIEFKMPKNASSSNKSKNKSKARSSKRKSRKATTGTIAKVNKIISRSINPISTLLLVKYFNAKNPDLEDFLKENDYDKGTLTLEQVKEFQTEESTEDMTSSEELEFMENNEEFGEPLLLIVDLKDEPTISKINKTFLETLNKIVCPS
jgi:hypothetical protein